MNQDVMREKLSALLDEELTELELRQVLRDSSDETLDELSRWQLTRDALKGAPIARVPQDFAAQVSAAIAEEEPHKKQWWSGVARTLVAASVAAATVTVGWQFWQPAEEASSPIVSSVTEKNVRASGDTSGVNTELAAAQPLTNIQAGINTSATQYGPLLRQRMGLVNAPEAVEKESQGQQPQIHLINVGEPADNTEE